MAKIATTIMGKKTKHKSNKIRMVGFKIENCVLYSCLRHTMRISRWFGYFPVEGLGYPAITELRFRFKSFYSIYFLCSLIGQLSMTYVTFYEFITNDLSLALFAHFTFYMVSITTSMLMINLAQKWPVLMKDVADMEQAIGELFNDKYLLLKTAGLGFFVLFLGLVEHLLCIMYAFSFVMYCLRDFSFNPDTLHLYFTKKLSEVPSNDFIFIAGILLEVSNTQATFVWTFVDVVVMIISMYLVICFRNFNKIIQLKRRNKNTDWGLLRMKYSNLVALVKKIDSHFSLFVLQSFFTNLFFTCLQLYNTIRNNQTSFTFCDQEGARKAQDSFIYTLYYSFSFTFLLARTFVVTLLAANVNTSACEPISVLGEIHASGYNIEIQRFYRQLTYTTIGLSGFFFYVTRQVILKVLGTIVTYELMLLQFKPAGFLDSSFQNNNISIINGTYVAST